MEAGIVGGHSMTVLYPVALVEWKKETGGAGVLTLLMVDWTVRGVRMSISAAVLLAHVTVTSACVCCAKTCMYVLFDIFNVFLAYLQHYDENSATIYKVQKSSKHLWLMIMKTHYMNLCL